MLPTPRSESVGKAQEVGLVDRVEDLGHGALENLILHGGDAQGPLTPIRLRNKPAA